MYILRSGEPGNEATFAVGKFVQNLILHAKMRPGNEARHKILPTITNVWLL